MKTWLATVLAVVAIGSGTVAIADKGSLDGKVFAGTTTEKGNAKTVPDTISFKAGMFHSTGCDAYGFGDGTYKATADGAFEADTVSAKEGKMHWKGMVKGDSLTIDAVWTKAGQKPIEYHFAGGAKK